MANYELHPEEVVLYEGPVTSKNYKGSLLVTLTTQKIVIERKKGLIKKELELVSTIALDTVKFYHDAAQVKQTENIVEIQTVGENIAFQFGEMTEAHSFARKVVDTVTGTTLTQRRTAKIKNVLNMVEETLGVDTKSAIKGVLENGVRGVIRKKLGKKG